MLLRALLVGRTRIIKYCRLVHGGPEKGVQVAQNNEDALAIATIEQMNLEIEKLRMEVAAAAKVNRVLTPTFIPLLTAVVAVAGFWFGVYQFARQQPQEDARRRVELHQLERQLMQEVRRGYPSADFELRKPLWEAQLRTYSEIVNASAAVVTTRGAKRRAAEADFWHLYRGSLRIVADMAMYKPRQADVLRTASRFAQCLDTRTRCAEEDLKQNMLALAVSCRRSTAATWQVEYVELNSDGSLTALH